jgi:hypothetical protein
VESSPVQEGRTRRGSSEFSSAASATFGPLVPHLMFLQTPPRYFRTGTLMAVPLELGAGSTPPPTGRICEGFRACSSTAGWPLQSSLDQTRALALCETSSPFVKPAPSYRLEQQRRSPCVTHSAAVPLAHKDSAPASQRRFAA